MSSASILGYLILSLSIGYTFAYPAFGEISVLNDTKQKYEDLVSTVQDIENKKNELSQKFNELSEEDKKMINTVLPSSLDFVRLVSQIDEVALRHGISIDNVSLAPLDSSVGSSIAEAGPPKPYNSAIIGFSFSSNYEKFNDFIDDLEKSLRILDVRSIDLKSEKEEDEYSYSVEFETYWLK